MQTEIVDLNELLSLSTELKTLAKDLDDSIERLSSTIREAQDYDGIDVAFTNKTMRSNLKTVSYDMTTVSRNVSDYTAGISTLDQDDISTDENLFDLGNLVDNIGEFYTPTNNQSSEPIKNNEIKIENMTIDDFDSLTTPVSLTGTIIEEKNNNTN